MELIRCTKKLRKALKLKEDDLKSANSFSEGLGGWHANLIYISRRKCVLCANDKTLLNFVITDLTSEEIRDFDNLFRHQLQQVLKEEGVEDTLRYRIIDEYREIGFAKSNSRSVLGSMNDLAENYTFHIEDKSGLQHADLATITKAMNRMPMGALSYKSPIQSFVEFYDIDSSSYKFY